MAAEFSNRYLAQIVARRLSDRMMEDMTDLIAEITTDVMQEKGMTIGDDASYDKMMDICSRIYIGAQ